LVVAAPLPTDTVHSVRVAALRQEEFHAFRSKWMVHSWDHAEITRRHLHVNQKERKRVRFYSIAKENTRTPAQNALKE
jgi:hypothetical protein